MADPSGRPSAARLPRDAVERQTSERQAWLAQGRRSRSRSRERRRSRSRSRSPRRRSPARRRRSRTRSRSPPRRSRHDSDSDQRDYGGYVPRHRKRHDAGLPRPPPPSRYGNAHAGSFVAQQLAQRVAVATKSAREVYVGNINSASVNTEVLTQFFNVALEGLDPSESGPPVSAVRSMAADGKFCFVELRTLALADAALALSGMLLGGRALTVNRPSGYVDPATIAAMAAQAAAAAAALS